MSQQSIYLHKSVVDQIEFLADILELSKSETVETMLRHVIDNDLEEDIWGDAYKEAMEDLETAIEESGDEESSSDEE